MAYDEINSCSLLAIHVSYGVYGDWPFYIWPC